MKELIMYAGYHQGVVTLWPEEKESWHTNGNVKRYGVERTCKWVNNKKSRTENGVGVRWRSDEKKKWKTLQEKI